MGKIAVVHNSKYGASKKYAGWISEETGGDLFEFAQADAATLKNYDVIVYCAGIYVGKITGIKKAQKTFEALEGKKIILAAVGSGVVNPGSIAAVEIKNLTAEMKEKGWKLFLFRGGFDYQRMKAGDRFLMSILVQVLKSRTLTETDVGARDIIESFGKQADYSDRASIKALVHAAINAVK